MMISRGLLLIGLTAILLALRLLAIDEDKPPCHKRSVEDLFTACADH